MPPRVSWPHLPRAMEPLQERPKGIVERVAVLTASAHGKSKEPLIRMKRLSVFALFVVFASSIVATAQTSAAPKPAAPAAQRPAAAAPVPVAKIAVIRRPATIRRTLRGRRVEARRAGITPAIFMQTSLAEWTMEGRENPPQLLLVGRVCGGRGEAEKLRQGGRRAGLRLRPDPRLGRRPSVSGSRCGRW